MMPAGWFGIDPLSPDAGATNTVIMFAVFLVILILITGVRG